TATPATPTDTTSARNTPGAATISLTVDGQTREFIVYVGRSVHATAAAPVVFMLHGTSGTGDEFFQSSQWREKADTVGLIAVFPTALTYCSREDENGDGDMVDAGEQKVFTKWAHGKLGGPELPVCTAQEIATLPAALRALVTHPLIDDTRFIDQVITWLKANRRIEEKRIYASGFSAGGAMVQRLLVERNSVFAALHAHAGGLTVPPVPSRAISFVYSLGSQDDRYVTPFGIPAFPIDAQTMAVPAFKSMATTRQLSVLQLADQYTYTEQIVRGVEVGRWAYRTSLVGASNSYEFVLFDGVTHIYPNGINSRLTMADLIWPFFATQRLP
ncbi:MAG: prolyl oligopeptidase family serine peptidase, partial [Gemmatimonadaceae bacterium]|nr:prolyl oligopeptidase family serine peptidase [Gemmatimonadaceae bacterium]